MPRSMGLRRLSRCSPRKARDRRVHYLACARNSCSACASPVIYPQFATHNAHTVAAVLDLMAGESMGVRAFEFQRLHGMGEAAAHPGRWAKAGTARVASTPPWVRTRICCAYLVRRLLENGANTSFVRQLRSSTPDGAARGGRRRSADRQVEVAGRRDRQPAHHVTGTALFGPAPGATLHEAGTSPIPADGARRHGRCHRATVPGTSLRSLRNAMTSPAPSRKRAARVLCTRARPGTGPTCVVGTVRDATARTTVDTGATGSPARQIRELESATPGGPAACRPSAAKWPRHLYEANMHAELMALAMAREAGKTLADGVAEVREAVDFLRYYAMGAEKDFEAPVRVPGPTRETNHLSLHGRGVFVLHQRRGTSRSPSSPGQVAAALAAGNTRARQASRADQPHGRLRSDVKLLPCKPGVPAECRCTCYRATGETSVGAMHWSSDPRLAGVCFTGSTRIPRSIINRRPWPTGAAPDAFRSSPRPAASMVFSSIRPPCANRCWTI